MDESSNRSMWTLQSWREAVDDLPAGLLADLRRAPARYVGMYQPESEEQAAAELEVVADLQAVAAELRGIDQRALRAVLVQVLLGGRVELARRGLHAVERAGARELCGTSASGKTSRFPA